MLCGALLSVEPRAAKKVKASNLADSNSRESQSNTATVNAENAVGASQIHAMWPFVFRGRLWPERDANATESYPDGVWDGLGMA